MAAIALVPAAAVAAPSRAGAALPTTSHASAAFAPRAATPTAHGSSLGPFSLLGLVIAFTVTTVVVVVAVQAGGRSSG